jgi:hypothetical protein
LEQWKESLCVGIGERERLEVGVGAGVRGVGVCSMHVGKTVDPDVTQFAFDKEPEPISLSKILLAMRL